MVITLVLAAVAVGTFMRLWFMFHQPLTSDEAIDGLMAHQILHGHFSAFYWGQAYGGVEPYVTALLYTVLGQSTWVLHLTPILLAALAAVLIWRVVRRLVPDQGTALLAGALLSVLLGGLRLEHDRGVGVPGRDDGLRARHVAVRAPPPRRRALARGRRRARRRRRAGLVVLPRVRLLPHPTRRSSWWRPCCRPAHGDAPAGMGGGSGRGRRVLRGGVGTVAVGERPKPPGARCAPRASRCRPGPRARAICRPSSTTPASSRSDSSAGSQGYWVFGNGHSTLTRGLMVLLGIAVTLAVVASLVACVLRDAKGRAFAAGVVVFPLLYAASPATWFWGDGRYAVFLVPLLVGTLAIGAGELSRLAHASGRGGWRRALPRDPRLALGTCVVLTMVLSLAGFHQLDSAGASSALRGWSDPDALGKDVAARLIAQGVRTGYADYWIAYKLDMLGGGPLQITVAGTDIDRSHPIDAAAKMGLRSAWLFVPPPGMRGGQRAIRLNALSRRSRRPGRAEVPGHPGLAPHRLSLGDGRARGRR